MNRLPAPSWRASFSGRSEEQDDCRGKVGANWTKTTVPPAEASKQSEVFGPALLAFALATPSQSASDAAATSDLAVSLNRIRAALQKTRPAAGVA
jgi:hypothetical protein